MNHSDANDGRATLHTQPSTSLLYHRQHDHAPSRRAGDGKRCHRRLNIQNSSNSDCDYHSASSAIKQCRLAQDVYPNAPQTTACESHGHEKMADDPASRLIYVFRAMIPIPKGPCDGEAAQARLITRRSRPWPATSLRRIKKRLFR